MRRQVEHHTDIAHALRKRTDASCVHLIDAPERPGAELRLQLDNGRIEALNVPCHQRHAGRCRHVAQPAPLVDRGCQRFLDERCDTTFDDVRRDLEVRQRRHRNTHDVELLLVEETPVVGVSAQRPPARRPADPLVVDVRHRDQLDPVQFAVHPDVVRPHRAKADDPCTQRPFSHARIIAEAVR